MNAGLKAADLARNFSFLSTSSLSAESSKFLLTSSMLGVEISQSPTKDLPVFELKRSLSTRPVVATVKRVTKIEVLLKRDSAGYSASWWP